MESTPRDVAIVLLIYEVVALPFAIIPWLVFPYAGGPSAVDWLPVGIGIFLVTSLAAGAAALAIFRRALRLQVTAWIESVRQVHPRVGALQGLVAMGLLAAGIALLAAGYVVPPEAGPWCLFSAIAWFGLSGIVLQWLGWSPIQAGGPRYMAAAFRTAGAMLAGIALLGACHAVNAIVVLAAMREDVAARAPLMVGISLILAGPALLACAWFVVPLGAFLLDWRGDAQDGEVALFLLRKHLPGWTTVWWRVMPKGWRVGKADPASSSSPGSLVLEPPHPGRARR